MPLTHLITNDGRRIPLADVDISRTVEDFGLPPADIAAVILSASSRDDVDIHTVTASQAESGARELYLRDTTNYARHPKMEMSSLMGTMRHAVINKEHPGLNVEQRFISKCGRFSEKHDSYVIKTGVLRDLKNVGYYKVLMCLKNGVEKEAAGYVMQLNMAALILQENDLPVTEMWLDFRPTGVGLREKEELAKKFNITDPTTISRQVPRLPANEVWTHYEKLWEAKNAALTSGIVPEMCSDKATWGGKKCWDAKNQKSWCPVAEECARLATIAGLKHPLNEVSVAVEVVQLIPQVTEVQATQPS